MDPAAGTDPEHALKGRLAGPEAPDITGRWSIEAEVPLGASRHVVRTVAGNRRTLTFTNRRSGKRWARAETRCFPGPGNVRPASMPHRRSPSPCHASAGVHESR